MKIKTTFVVLFLVIFVLLFALCTKGKVSSPLENARLANEGFRRCLHFVEGWLSYRDQESGLIPRNLSRDRDIWNAKDCAADNYPFMVLTTMVTGKDSLYPVMLQMLEAERSLTSRIGSLPDDFSFSGKGFVYKEPDIHRILFGASEYIKDGLLPLTEWMGKSPWSGRMFEMLDDIWKYAPVETPYGAIVSENVEVNGDMLQVLSRVYWMTGEEKYLDWAIRLGDYHLLDHHPLKMDRIRLRDHGCEIVSGLCELYATVHFARPEKKNLYQKPLYALMDSILVMGRNEHGLFYDYFNPITGEHSETIADTWGYTLNGYYTLYLIDHTPRYREAVLKALENIPFYTGYAWEGESADGYADAVEGALNLYNRERLPETAGWIDSQIQVMWGKQKPDGIIEGWHGDGNFARTTLMYCLWKTQGLVIRPWSRDVSFGAVMKGKDLHIVIVSKTGWEGELVFDCPRHSVHFNLPLDWPRINQMPEWFTVREDSFYRLDLKPLKKKITFSGRDLTDGLKLNLMPGTPFEILVRKEDHP